MVEGSCWRFRAEEPARDTIPANDHDGCPEKDKYIIMEQRFSSPRSYAISSIDCQNRTEKGTKEYILLCGKGTPVLKSHPRRKTRVEVASNTVEWLLKIVKSPRKISWAIRRGLQVAMGEWTRRSASFSVHGHCESVSGRSVSTQRKSQLGNDQPPSKPFSYARDAATKI